MANKQVSKGYNISHLYNWNGHKTPSMYMSLTKLFIRQPTKVCRKQNYDDLVFILIGSRSGDFKKRNAIRNSWANTSLYQNLALKYSIFFVVGLPKGTELNKYIVRESDLEDDTLLVNIEEDYKMLTVQLLLGLVWIYQNCPGGKFILKVDDDTYVHLENYEKYMLQIDKEKPKKATEVYGGQCFEKPKVVRNNKKNDRQLRKFVVSRDAYSWDLFPSYCNGPAYFFSFSLLRKIVANCPYHCTGLLHRRNDAEVKKTCFWIWEDVFFGSCMNTFEPAPYINFTAPPHFFQPAIMSVTALRKKRKLPYGIFHPVKGVDSLTTFHSVLHDLNHAEMSVLQHQIGLNIDHSKRSFLKFLKYNILYWLRL